MRLTLRSAPTSRKELVGLRSQTSLVDCHKENSMPNEQPGGHGGPPLQSCWIPLRLGNLRDIPLVCSRRGSALLGVMWLSIALTAIAFTLSRTVRTELDRADLNVDSTRAYFLAKGGIERAMMYLLAQRPAGELGPGPGFTPGQRWMRFSFPAGDVAVEIVGENGKLNVNHTQVEPLARTLAASGFDPTLSLAMASRIEAARSPSRAGILDPVSNPGRSSSFSRRPSSFKYLEELLIVRGMTPELLFGTYRQDTQGNWIRIGGLHRHLSVLGSGSVDVNYASPQVLEAAGVPGPMIAALVQQREIGPIDPNHPEVAALSRRQGPIQVSAGGWSMAYTLWAEARLRTGKARRVVGALVQRAQSGVSEPIRVVRWYDTQF